MSRNGRCAAPCATGPLCGLKPGFSTRPTASVSVTNRNGSSRFTASLRSMNLNLGFGELRFCRDWKSLRLYRQAGSCPGPAAVTTAGPGRLRCGTARGPPGHEGRRGQLEPRRFKFMHWHRFRARNSVANASTYPRRRRRSLSTT